MNSDWKEKLMQEARERALNPSLDEKTIKAVSEVTQDDLPAINAVIAKGDRVEIGPGPNCTVKIVHIKRKFLKSGQGKDCLKC